MIGGASLRCGGMALWCLVAAGCAGLPNEPTERAISVAAPSAPAAATAAASPEPARYPPVTVLTDSSDSPLDELPAPPAPEPALPSTPTANDRPENADPTAVELTAPSARGLEPSQAPNPSSVAPATITQTLDFSSLVTRLRSTKAIGLLTKVAFKSESDNLLKGFRAYHTQQGTATLTDLRRAYDVLFQKLHSLLEYGDPSLARDIDRSQAAIWEFLSDPHKFSASPLLAGA